MPYVLPQSHFKLPRTKGGPYFRGRAEMRFVWGEYIFILLSLLSAPYSLSSFFPFFFSQRAHFLIVRRLHTTNAVLIVFAYSQPSIHTKSTLSWREDCSVLALQSTIFLLFFFFFISPLTGQQMKSLFSHTMKIKRNPPRDSATKYIFCHESFGKANA